MRFKYLTATMLREAAMRIYENPNYICFTLDELANKEFSDARLEMVKVLTDMGVSTGGWLDYKVKGVSTCHYQLYKSTDHNDASVSHPEMIEMRVIFLLMLADAVAYKPNRGKRKVASKFDGSKKPFSENPSKPGVYAVVPRMAPTMKHYSKWDGNKWCLTDYSPESAEKNNRQSPSINTEHSTCGSYSHWINTKLA